MAEVVFPDGLVERGPGGGSIVLVVLDGIGGLPHPETGKTELEAARTPHLDALAGRACLGMLDPVGPGITPGSGPGHLSLFGYDPVHYLIGRGALSALGVGFDLRPGDVAVRLNLASFDAEGRVSDRRASRPSDAEGERVIDKVRAALHVPEDVELFLFHEKEHRAVLILRGDGLGADIEDTDPQETGVPALEPRAREPGSERAAALMADLLGQARSILANEERVHGFLARGFALYHGYPGLRERFGLQAVAVAKYPMYRGVARLVGMDVNAVPVDDADTAAQVGREWGSYDFYFVHFKATDSRGEDGDFDAKVAAIESVDAVLPAITALEPDVLIVTGDHSTPATYAAHSWHPVPVLVASRWARPTAAEFGERACRLGDLGRFRGMDLMSHALAHAGRLEKYGA